jgi:hypothetical protein
VKTSKLTCKLTSPELRIRKEQVIAALKSKILDSRELVDGYEYKFDASDDMLDQLTEFIKSERICCEFFDFGLNLKNNQVWLSITGPEGSKEFIKTELAL